MMAITRRHLLAWLALPAGCSLQPLSPLKIRPALTQTPLPALRPPAVGQSWTYQQLNHYNGQRVDILQESIAAISPRITLQRQSAHTGPLASEIQSRWGWVVQDPSWDLLQTYEAPMPLWLEPLTSSAVHDIDTHYTVGNSPFRYWIQAQTQVKGLETVDLPIGSFQTVRIEKLIRQSHYDSGKQFLLRRETLWLAPEIGRWVARETNGSFRRAGKRLDEGREDHFRWELTAWV